MVQRYIAIHEGRCRRRVYCTDPRCEDSYCWTHDVAPQVIGYPGASFKGFNNLNDAIAFAKYGCTNGCHRDEDPSNEVEIMMSTGTCNVGCLI